MTNSTPTIQVQLKNFKEAGGDETLRFEASLYIKGKKAAIVSNGGTGGGHSYHFLSGDLKQQFDLFVTELQTAELKKEDRLHHHIAEYLASMRESFPDYSQAKVDRDMVIDCLISDWREQKQFKSWCCRGRLTVFRLPSDPVGEYRTIKYIYGAEIKAQLIQKYGGEIEIANDLIRR